jgi:SAM-dependent MidA family methyltransferase
VPEGARAEVHRSYREWLSSWVPLLRRGRLLTIDYGDTCESLYGKGGAGTLRAYFANTRLEERDDLYRRIGLQDLTCDVSFTDLALWGEAHGLVTEALVTQRELLERYGVDLSMATAGSPLEFVARPEGAGTRIRALLQRVQRTVGIRR